MMRLNDLYPGVGTEIVIKDISINSKQVEKGDLFVCTTDGIVDWHEFIDEAIENGASAIIVSKDIRNKSVPIIKVPDANRELPYLCQKFYGYPDTKLKMIGVTGTDGKTSTATIIQSLIGSDFCGYIGTNHRSCAAFSGDNPDTTPEANLLYNYLNEFIRFNCKYAVVEASSEGFLRGRLQAMKYDAAVYTNITSEHLDIHGSFDNYLQCKLMLFRQTKEDGICILNKDDPYYEQVRVACKGKVFSYGKDADNTLQIVDFKVFANKTDIKFNYKGNVFDVESPLLGDFNVSNLAAALLTCLELGIKLEDLLSKIGNLYVDGRLQLLNTRTPYYVIVDYARTPSGITKLLSYIKTLDINRCIVVIGQPGEVDYSNRAVVGEILVKNVTHTIFTMDDPQNEDPSKICDDIVKVIKDTYTNYEIVLDRRKAIQKAIDIAQEKDMILILGKGNSTYQNIENKKIYFNDVEEAYQAVVNRNLKEELSR